MNEKQYDNTNSCLFLPIKRFNISSRIKVILNRRANLEKKTKKRKNVLVLIKIFGKGP